MCIPVGVENGSCVAAEEGHQLGGAADFIDGDDGEGASSACFPVDRDVLGVGLRGCELSRCVVAWSRARLGWADLDQVGVPRVLRNAQVVVADFLDLC
jgi:hypothetical protein